jgi:hypothetical protein
MPTPDCGNGLHGLHMGNGDGVFLDWSEDAIWMVVASDSHIDLGGKSKFPSAMVVCVGDRKKATDFLIDAGCPIDKMVGAFVTSGYRGTSTSGERGTLVIKYWDGDRYRLAVGYVGENGIKPNTPYRVDHKGNFYEAKDKP